MRSVQLLALLLAIAAPVASQERGGARGPEVDVRRVGGYGSPDDDAGERREPTPRSDPGAGDKPDPFVRTEPLAAVLLPEMGSYRAPRILRLAGKLAGLEVRVAHRSLNDAAVEIPRQLAKRHVGLAEMRILLAANKLFLVEWDHPERGTLLVATNEPAWEPPEREHKHVLEVHPRIFAQTWELIEAEIERRNAEIPAAAPRYAAMPVPRLGKIWIWAPTRAGLEEIVRTPEKLDIEREKSRAQLATYRARHFRASDLYEVLMKTLSDGERSRVRIAVGAWSNVLILRGTEEMIATIERRLEKLDVPKKGRTR